MKRRFDEDDNCNKINLTVGGYKATLILYFLFFVAICKFRMKMVNPMFFLWSARLSGSFWMNLITVTSICLRWVLLLPMTLLSSFSWVMTVKLLMMVEPSLFRVLEALDH